MIIFEEQQGHHVLRVTREGASYRGNVGSLAKDGPILIDDDLDRLKRRLRRSVDIVDPGYYGIEAAMARFLRLFPMGFKDSSYIEEERGHKIAAAGLLASRLSLRNARAASQSQASAVLPVFDTGLLKEDEFSLIWQVLCSPNGGDFIRGAARFTDGRYAEGLQVMEAAIRPYGKATWPMVTYLPWLWGPEEHIFLDPETDIDFAARIGDGFDHEYEPTLFPDVYRSFQDLADGVARQISALAPADMIDIHGFIWAVTRRTLIPLSK